MTQTKSPHNVPYFHGKITRDRAEDLLMSQGAIEGMFLLRESVSNNFVISICHCNKVNHYNIEKQSDGSFQILTGRRFPGPVELVDHHMMHLDGFLTLARIPLERYPAGASYYILQGVKSSLFEENLKRKAADLGLKDSTSIDEALGGPLREHLKKLVLKDIHSTQPWFHHFIRRSEAEKRLEVAGHTEGQFLVRQRREDFGFVLTVSYQEAPKHYKINCHFEKLYIEGGQYFDSLIEMIDHYHFRQDGLLCKLRFSVECPGFMRLISDVAQVPRESCLEGKHSSMCELMNYSRVSLGAFNTKFSPESREWSRETSRESDNRQKLSDNISASTDLINFSEWSTNLPRLLNETQISSSMSNLKRDSSQEKPLPRLPFCSKPPCGPRVSECNVTSESTPISPVHSIFDQSLNEPIILDDNWTEPVISMASRVCSPSMDDQLSRKDISSRVCSPSVDEQLSRKAKTNSVPLRLQPSDLSLLDPLFASETQKIYDALPPNDVSLNLSRDRLDIRQKLGGGNFGFVYGGYYLTNDGNRIPVAIKMLKKELNTFVSGAELLMEARTMSQLRHKHIVRLIGICKSDQMLLVLELAPLGPINKYLRHHQSTPTRNLIELLTQVARGMAYLEASKFVHRDLAARNVLLVTDCYAKISDFGMSKALNVGHEYYRAATAGKWPLKWYAPECIYYFRFDSKADVWSYGITMWEVFSYGDRPYKDLKGTQILSMLDKGQRLKKPNNCPDPVYEIMLQCWNIDSVRRPTFAELVLMMSRLLTNNSSKHVENNDQGSYIANSSGSSVAKTSYGSGESSQFPSPPISSKAVSKWNSNSSVTNTDNANW